MPVSEILDEYWSWMKSNESGCPFRDDLPETPPDEFKNINSIIIFNTRMARTYDLTWATIEEWFRTRSNPWIRRKVMEANGEPSSSTQGGRRGLEGGYRKTKRKARRKTSKRKTRRKARKMKTTTRKTTTRKTKRKTRKRIGGDLTMEEFITRFNDINTSATRDEVKVIAESIKVGVIDEVPLGNPIAVHLWDSFDDEQRKRFYTLLNHRW